MNYRNYNNQPRPRQSKPSHRGHRWLVVVGVLAAAAIVFWLLTKPANAPQSRQQANQTAPTEQTNRPASDTPNYSITDPASPWVVVNKQRPLRPKTFAPQLVVPRVKLKGSSSAMNMHVGATMAPHLEKLFDVAKAAGHPLMLSSGYRSYDYQVTVHRRQVEQLGKAKADTLSARPGYSEHQTGWAADVAPTSGQCDLSQCFGDTATGQWLAANAWHYGFIIRYPKGAEQVTGYEWEPWHIRYIGDYAAKQMRDQGITTLEKYFGTGPAPTY